MSVFQLPSQGDRLSIPWYGHFDPTQRLIRGKAYHRLKRVLDLWLCILALPCLLPGFLICGILIKLDSPGGPILYRQQRTGRGGRRFGMYKFRTMVPNADALKKDLMHLNERQQPDFRITNDPRTTRLGRIMRRTSLDELPQIINVVKGEMSLVGPRPTSFPGDTYLLWQTERLDVLPGITGLWQIEGRGETEFDERSRLDITYIERRSIWFDINILARTVPVVLGGRGAH